MAEPTETPRNDGRVAPRAVLGRVLVVDDDPALRRALARLLSAHAYESVCASNATEALEALDGAGFDAALVDVRMPEIEGPDLVPLIRAKQPRLEIIMITAFEAAESAVKSFRAGAFDYLAKPVAPAVLAAALARATAHRRNEEATALHRASHAIFSVQQLDRLPEVIISVAMEVMSADAASLLLPAMDGALQVTHAHGLDAEVQRTTRISIGEGVAGRVAATGKPTVIVGSASDHAEFVGAVTRSRVKSSIVYPMMSGSRLVGILTFNRLSEEAPFRPDDLDRASVLASQVMLALENHRLSRQTALSEKLAAVGQLAAGVAHEINSPVQFVGDGVHFLGESVEQMLALISRYELLLERSDRAWFDSDLIKDVESFSTEIDMADLRLELPKALRRTKDGVVRVTNIVRSMKTIGRTDGETKTITDLADLVDATLTVARSEYKYVADVEADLSAVPRVMALPGELSQVFLNLIVNAAHAIGDKMKARGTGERGRIMLKGWVDGAHVHIRVSDTGCGIPENIQSKIFDPFFTTKEPDRGTGLGLSIVRSIIVEKHGGDIVVESEVGVGTSFLIRFPTENLARGEG